MLILHAILVASTLAVLGVAYGCYRHVCRYLRVASSQPPEPPAKDEPDSGFQPSPE